MSPDNLINYSAYQYNLAINEQVKAICAPLKNLNITHFGYIKFFKDGTYLKICNDLTWVDNYLKNSLVDKTEAFGESLRIISPNTMENQLWPQKKGKDCLAALHDFNIWNGINFHIKTEEYIEVYYFATTRDNTQIYNLYVTHLELLKRFLFYFKDKAQHIIDIKDQAKLAKQKSSTTFFSIANQPLITKYEDHNILNFLDNTEIKRYYISEKNLHMYFTNKECICLKYLSMGKSTKEIGKILNISSRTVESYINNMKLKLNITSSSTLIDIFINSLLKDGVF